MPESVAIVGAGVTGLACAAALGRGAVAVDRVPVAGGVAGWRHPDVVRLVRDARRAGARLLLGETATRWDGERLLVIGPDGPRRIAARTLVVASGTRPRGRAELGLAGSRPAGAVAATVACHLAESGLLVGRFPAVVGGGDWAARAVAELLHAGALGVSVVAPRGVLRPLPSDRRVRVHEGLEPTAVLGGARVTGLVAGATVIACDAVVLAHGLVPLRNVDGAVWDGPGVTYAQPDGDPGSLEAAVAAGRAAALEAAA